MKNNKEYKSIIAIDAINAHINILDIIKKDIEKSYIIEAYKIEYLELATQRTLSNLMHYIKK